MNIFFIDKQVKFDDLHIIWIFCSPKERSYRGAKFSLFSFIEMLRELAKDPLVLKETRIDVLYGLSNLMDKAYDSAEQLTGRLLLLYGEKDEIIPPQPVLSFYRRLPMQSQVQQQMILYEEGYHMLLRDLQAEVSEFLKT